jgi:hypothetical protein
MRVFYSARSLLGSLARSRIAMLRVTLMAAIILATGMYVITPLYTDTKRMRDGLDSNNKPWLPPRAASKGPPSPSYFLATKIVCPENILDRRRYLLYSCENYPFNRHHFLTYEPLFLMNSPWDLVILSSKFGLQ